MQWLNKINSSTKLKMKIKKTLLTLIAFFILNIITSEAGFFEISHECQEENCISGQDINWSVSFENKGSGYLWIEGVELIDSINLEDVANFHFGYNPYNSDKTKLYLNVVSSQKKTLNIQAKIPTPNIKNSLIYTPCIIFALNAKDEYYVGNYTSVNCYPNESITVFECLTDNHCKINELCQNKKCKQISCDDCQYILNKKCISYQCCSSDACNLDESCTNNKCTALTCLPEERILNHSCIKMECNYDEQIVNHSCVKLGCNYDEYAKNHSCLKLNCSYDEHISNNLCVKLECNDYEGYINHSCVKLECNDYEGYINHSCAKLDCGFFEKININKCVIDKQFIYKFAIELIITISIIYLFMLDIKKYKSEHKK